MPNHCRRRRRVSDSALVGPGRSPGPVLPGRRRLLQIAWNDVVMSSQTEPILVAGVRTLSLCTCDWFSLQTVSQETSVNVDSGQQSEIDSSYVNLNPQPRKSCYHSRIFIASASVGFGVLVSVLVVAGILGRSRSCATSCALPNPSSAPPNFVYSRYRSCR